MFRQVLVKNRNDSEYENTQIEKNLSTPLASENPTPFYTEEKWLYVYIPWCFTTADEFAISSLKIFNSLFAEGWKITICFFSEVHQSCSQSVFDVCSSTSLLKKQNPLHLDWGLQMSTHFRASGLFSIDLCFRDTVSQKAQLKSP